jgi:putative hydrolase of the HAD superfamily
LVSVSLSIPGRVVVFDYGEVISKSPSERDRAELVAIADVGAAPFWRSYDEHRDRLDEGLISVPEYWAIVASELGVTWSLADLQQLWAADFRSWTSVEPATVDILSDLAAGSTRMALLSNAGFDFASPFRFAPIGTLFERIFVSAELRLLKPAAAIYLHVASELGITPAEMVFVDNKSANTDAAAALGITTHHFVDANGLRTFLVSLAE